MQTANRQGIEIAKRSLVLFVKGTTKAELSEKLGKWNESSALLPQQRPAQRPRPWKLQVADFLVIYLESKSVPVTPEDVLTQVKLLPLLLEAVSHPKPRHGEDSVWPIQLTLRNSEGAQLVKDALLHECFKGIMGKDHDLGIKVSRHLPGQATRAVLKELEEDVKGKGKGGGTFRRSPKREGDGGQDSRANQRQKR